MPSDKNCRKQVIVDRHLLALVRKYGEKFNLSDQRDAAVVNAALGEWVGEQEGSQKHVTGAVKAGNLGPGHEYRLNMIMQVLQLQKRQDGNVGPIGHKAIEKLLSSIKDSEQLGRTFIRKAMVELVDRGKLEIVTPGAGPIGNVYRIVKP